MSDSFTLVERTVKEEVHEYTRRKGGWQLPCGCIGPDIFLSETAEQAYCADCKRGWYIMGARWGSHAYCKMLDGKPQGEPVLVLMTPLELKVGDNVEVIKDGRKYLPGYHATHNMVGLRGTVVDVTAKMAHVRLHGNRYAKFSKASLKAI